MPALKTPAGISNILFATDFSPSATAAIPYAAKLAEQFGAKLWAIHVDPAAVNPMTNPADWAEFEKASEERQEIERQQLRESFPHQHAEALVEEGDIWATLRAVISEKDINLLILGTHGRTGVGKLMLGSVAEEVFRGAPCPTLTVGPRLDARLHHTGAISRILFATDFGTATPAAARAAIEFARAFGAKLTVLHVQEPLDTVNMAQLTELEPVAINRMRELVPPETVEKNAPDYLVVSGDPAEKILEVAAKRHCDLIVLGLHRTRGYPVVASHLPIATAHKVVSQAECPVLTVGA